MGNENFIERNIESNEVCCKTEIDCNRRNYPTADALEEAYNAGYRAGYCDGLETGRKEGFGEGYKKGLRDGCKKIKEKILKCIDKIECC